MTADPGRCAKCGAGPLWHGPSGPMRHEFEPVAAQKPCICHIGRPDSSASRKGCPVHDVPEALFPPTSVAAQPSENKFSSRGVADTIHKPAHSEQQSAGAIDTPRPSNNAAIAADAVTERAEVENRDSSAGRFTKLIAGRRWVLHKNIPANSWTGICDTGSSFGALWAGIYDTDNCPTLYEHITVLPLAEHEETVKELNRIKAGVIQMDGVIHDRNSVITNLNAEIERLKAELGGLLKSE